MPFGSDKRLRDRLIRLLVLIGGLALLGAMAVDTVAVIGRHLRMPLNGSIEIVQGLLVIAGASAMFVATLFGVHATVRLLTERLPARAQDVMHRAIDFASALYFVALVAGGVWLAIDMWDGFERSELLGVPYRPLRLAANLALAGIAAVLLLRVVRGRRE